MKNTSSKFLLDFNESVRWAVIKVHYLRVFYSLSVMHFSYNLQISSISSTVHVVISLDQNVEKSASQLHVTLFVKYHVLFISPWSNKEGSAWEERWIEVPSFDLRFLDWLTSWIEAVQSSSAINGARSKQFPLLDHFSYFFLKAFWDLKSAGLWYKAWARWPMLSSK